MIAYPKVGAGSTQQLSQSLPVQKEAHKCHVCEATNIIEDAQMSCGCRLQNLARQIIVLPCFISHMTWMNWLPRLKRLRMKALSRL